jgi:predicted house-cleaning noncanonical NTP pyrophosphatase (MazG superfamily)
MKGNVIYLDKDQLKLINLIDEWLRDEMMEELTTHSEIGVIANARVFLTKILEKGWYREGGEDQFLLMDLRTQWIKDGGKWKS